MTTRIVAPPGGIQEAVDLLAAGELAALPTETVYGLGASALDPVACAKIFEAKDRPLADPLIVHLPEMEWLDQLARPNSLATTLASTFWPGPLTLVLRRSDRVPDLVTSGQDTVALRLSAHPVFREVAAAFGKPIAAPSANRFGRISPTTAAHVLAELDGRISLILDGGPCMHGIESTIVLVRDGVLTILRHGPITAESLSAFARIQDSPSHVVVPGGLKSHYAPKTPLLLDAPASLPARTGLLALRESRPGFAQTEILSPTGDLRHAAANLYAALRRLDEAELELIVADPIPETGLGAAIMDRLRKASAAPSGY